MISDRTLRFLLLPLVPLSAIGLVSLVNRALPSERVLVDCSQARAAPQPPAPPPSDFTPQPA